MLYKYEFYLLQEKADHRQNMEKQKMKHTQQKQFKTLVEFMQQHPDLSKGLLKSANDRNSATNLWKRLTCQLNAAGPPMRDIAGWKKVWADYKVHLRAKLGRNKQSLSGTGSGPSVFVPLTELEERVSELLSVEKSVAGNTSSVAFGAKPKEVPVVPRESPAMRNESLTESRNSGSVNSDHDDEAGSEESDEEVDPTSNTINLPRRKQSLLEYQVDNQISYHKYSTRMLSEINDNLGNIFKVLKKSKNLQKKD